MGLNLQYCAIAFITLWAICTMFVRYENTGDPLFIDSMLGFIFAICLVCMGGIVFGLGAAAVGAFT